MRLTGVSMTSWQGPKDRIVLALDANLLAKTVVEDDFNHYAAAERTCAFPGLACFEAQSSSRALESKGLHGQLQPGPMSCSHACRICI